MTIFGGDYGVGYRNVTCENPLLFWGKIVPVEQIFSYQLPTGDESVASEGQALSSIRSRLGVENQHRFRPMPFAFRLIEASILIFQIRKDANSND